MQHDNQLYFQEFEKIHEEFHDFLQYYQRKDFEHLHLQYLQFVVGLHALLEFDKGMHLIVT